MGHKAHPTCKPKQLQNNNNQQNVIKYEYDNGDTYTIEQLENSCLLRVEKNDELIKLDGIHEIVE